MILAQRHFLGKVLLALVLVVSFLVSQSPVATRGIDYWIFDGFGIQIFDSFLTVGLKDVHLDGAGLLNHVVLIGATVESLDTLGVHMVVIDERARMLVDVSKLQNSHNAGNLSRGDHVMVQGVVKTGEKGHYYLVANALHRG